MTPHKSWQERAQNVLNHSLSPIPHELNELDWKETLSSNKDRLAEHLSAFANYPGGGFLAYGIDARGHSLGVSPSDAEHIITQLTNIARDGLVPSQQIDHCAATFQGQSLLFIYIPESIEKPVSLKGKGYEYAYIRTGGQTRRMNRLEITSAVVQSRQLRYEELEALSCPLRAVSEHLLVDKWLQLMGKPNPGTEDAATDMLVNEKMILRNGDRSAITNLGAIVAARDLSRFIGKERFSVRVIKYRGKSRIDAEHEREFVQGYGVGFQDLIQYIVSQVPTSEIIRDALRKTVPVYPEITIRELVANALIHRDFFNTATHPMVEIFADRMEITNPGTLLPSVKIERLIDTTPESRNELLARAMRRMGICEERGSGIDRALFEIELYGLPAVDFEEGENFFKVILSSPRTFKQMSSAERLRACYQHCCLRYVTGENMTTASLRGRLGLGSSQNVQAWKVVTDAIRGHLIKPADPRNKSKKFASYVPGWA